MPRADQQQAIHIAADTARRWREDGHEVWLLQGDCRVSQGGKNARSRAAVLWIDRAESAASPPNKVIAYFEGDVAIDYDDRRRNRTTSTSWLERFYSTSQIRIHTPPPRGKPPELPDIYHRGASLWAIGTESQLRPAQFTVPTPQAQPEVIPAPSGQASAGTRRIRIQRRSSVGVQAQWFPVPERNEWVAVISGGVNLLVEGLPDLGTIDVSTDRLVIWTAGTEAPDLSGDALQRADTPLEIYMEGNIVFRQGDRVIYARSMYYNITHQYGVVLEAEMLTPVPRYRGLVRLKADVLQQVDRHNFVATGGAITTSRLGVPTYWFQAEEIRFQDLQFPQVDPVTGQAAIDPATGQPLVDHQLLATARNIFVYLGGFPVFYWPVIATDASKKTYYLDRISVDNDSVFGTQLRTDWDLYQLLGIENPPPGTEWTAAVDLLSDRGIGLGTDFIYDFADPFSLDARHRGELHAWGIHDDGTDNLGRGRRSVPPEEDFRGRILGRHRSDFASGWQLTGEVGLISDRNFLEQFYEREWDELKDQTTGIEIKRYAGNQSYSVSSDIHVNDFFTQTEWLPRLDHIWLGQSLLGDTITWYGHSHAGYAQLESASLPSNSVEFNQFALLPWEPQDPQGSGIPGNRAGVRAGTRQEFDLPLQLGAVKVVPYVLGDASYYGEDLAGREDTRLLGQVGVRSSLSMWRVDPSVRRPLLNVNGIAHKVTFQTEMLYADSDKDLAELPLYDNLDDDATEAFRHRFGFTTFPGGIPPMFDERSFALRSGMQSDVTAHSLEVADDLALVNLGVRQRWQTKRGLPGRERTIDWITLDIGGTFFPDPDRDNFGQSIGLVNYDFRWHVGDRFTVLSDGFYDFFHDGLRMTTLGATITKPQVGTLYAGIRNAEGPFSSTALASSFTYRMSDKWLATVGTAFDLGPTGDIGSRVELTRIGESFLVTVGGSYDASRDNLGVRLLVEPRFLASSRNRIAGDPLPPVGAFGLE